MSDLMKLASLVTLVCSSIACGIDADTAIDTTEKTSSYLLDIDVGEQLQAIPGLEVTEVPEEAPNGYRFFRLVYTQPVDHNHPEGPWFEQHMALLHRSFDAPVIFEPEGYALYAPWVSELTAMLSANQLSVEHRYYGASRPEPADFQHLNIEQAAADHHRVVQAIRPLYDGVWISTGGSKGGMTALYHRRFYPDDVDATVPYVAPITFGPEDMRYAEFLDNVGDSDCRQRLRDFQREALQRRATLVPLIEAVAAQYGMGFTRIRGGADAALDIAVGEYPFYLWQYGDPVDCRTLPTSSSSDIDIVYTLAGTIYYAIDAGVEYFLPYYYQARTQLGYPHLETDHIQDLLLYSPNDYTLYTGDMPVPEFDWAALNDIAFWAYFEGESILYIYGENDPWTAGAFPVYPGGAHDTHLFIAPASNHYAGIADLMPADRATVHAILESWTGITPTSVAPSTSAPQAQQHTWLVPASTHRM